MHNSSIKVSVETEYLSEQSIPSEHRFVWAYTIRIQNNGDESARLISRYWKIVDEKDKIQEVEGLGVVGQQPLLAPGESYRYSSGVVLNTAMGVMEGHYIMQKNDGSEFSAAIPAFSLSRPGSIH